MYSSLVFSELKLIIAIGGTEAEFLLPDLPAGDLGVLLELQFVNDVLIDYALLSGRVSSRNLQIGPSGSEVLATDLFTAGLWPSSSSGLSPGTDLTVLTISTAASSTIPEPGSLFLAACGLAALLVSGRNARRANRG